MAPVLPEEKKRSPQSSVLGTMHDVYLATNELSDDEDRSSYTSGVESEGTKTATAEENLQPSADWISCRDVILKSKMATERTFALPPSSDHVRRFEVRVSGLAGLEVTLSPARGSLSAGEALRFVLTVQLHRPSVVDQILTVTRRSQVWGGREVVTVRLAAKIFDLSTLPHLEPSERRDLVQNKLNSISQNIADHEFNLVSSMKNNLDLLLAKSLTLQELGMYKKSQELLQFVYDAQVEMDVSTFQTLIQMFYLIEEMHDDHKSEPWGSFLGMCKASLKSKYLDMKLKREFIKTMAEMMEKEGKFAVCFDFFSETQRAFTSS